jgi:tetratricopeptide (TPR) repeat protein
LEQVAGKNDPPTSDLARLALAENYAGNGDNEKAIALYEQLLSSSANLKPAIEVGLGHVYEKTGNIEKAVEAYLEAAKPDRSTGAGSEAEKRLQALAPDRLKELPPPSTLPFQP